MLVEGEEGEGGRDEAVDQGNVDLCVNCMTFTQTHTHTHALMHTHTHTHTHTHAHMHTHRGPRGRGRGRGGKSESVTEGEIREDFSAPPDAKRLKLHVSPGFASNQVKSVQGTKIYPIQYFV